MRKKHKKQHKPEKPAASAPGAPVTTEAPVAAVVQPRGVPAPRWSAELPAEEAEPRAGLAAAPLWLVVLLGVLFYWSTMYLDGHAGGFRAEVYEPYRSFEDVVDHNPIDEAAIELKKGRIVYDASCSSCHQSTGSGNPSMNFPPLSGSEWVLAGGPNRIIRVVLDGATGPITVKGAQFEGASMPPQRPNLSDEQIAQVLSYVRDSFGNKASRIDPADVKKIRQQTTDRSAPWTEKELLAVPEKN